MDLGLKIFLAGMLLFALSLPLLNGKYPDHCITMPIVTCFFGGLITMLVGGFLTIWG